MRGDDDDPNGEWLGVGPDGRPVTPPIFVGPWNAAQVNAELPVDEMELLWQMVTQNMGLMPMKPPKKKGLARFVESDLDDAVPDPGYCGIKISHFEPPTYVAPGEYEATGIDRMLNLREEHAALFEPPKPPLSSVAEWLDDGLQLPPTSRMRRNPRFLRVLKELSEPKYSDAVKLKFAHNLRTLMMLDPDDPMGYAGTPPTKSYYVDKRLIEQREIEGIDEEGPNERGRRPHRWY